MEWIHCKEGFSVLCLSQESCSTTSENKATYIKWPLASFSRILVIYQPHVHRINCCVQYTTLWGEREWIHIQNAEQLHMHMTVIKTSGDRIYMTKCTNTSTMQELWVRLEFSEAVQQVSHKQPLKVMTTTTTKRSYSYHPERCTGRHYSTPYFTLPLAFSVHYIVISVSFCVT